MRNKARAACAICKIPKEIRAQLGRAATKKGFTQGNQIEWLHALGYKDATEEALRQHVSARHDSEEAFSAQA